MTRVTLHVLDGVERGRVYLEVPTPVRIGREDENDIRLTDERVSRFHAKIQEDSGRLILTDLGSTNGTRVNGYPVQMRILQQGDQISIGRTMLMLGGLDVPAVDQIEGNPELEKTVFAGSTRSAGVEHPFPQGPPECPTELRPVQKVQLSDLLSYLHDRLAQVLHSGEESHTTNPASMQVSKNHWNSLLQVELALAHYLRNLSSNESE